MNLSRREETEREREQILAMIADNKRLDEQQATKLRDHHMAYRADLLGQIDYNRRLRHQQMDEQRRLDDRQREAEAEYRRKIDHLLDKPVIQKVHPIRRGLYQSQSAAPRLSYRDRPVTMNH